MENFTKTFSLDLNLFHKLYVEHQNHDPDKTPTGCLNSLINFYGRLRRKRSICDLRQYFFNIAGKRLVDRREQNRLRFNHKHFSGLCSIRKYVSTQHQH